MRLLMPTVRPPRTSSTSPTPRSPRLKPKLIRARSASVSVTVTQDITDSDVGALWIGKSCRFQVEQELLEIEGYQMYAVEKWIVERSRPVTVLTVYTGDPSHKITVTALTPSTSLSLTEAQAEWESALHHLRRDGARPKDTPAGTLYTTSLANFRSDFTIVHIPHGNFLAVKEQLYTNIGLLRMGCSGRSAVGLEDVSETTKDRFLSMYHLPSKPQHPASISPTSPHSATPFTAPSPIQSHPKDRTLFNATVLELVKLIQASLAIAGMFPATDIDGLLCDVTVDGVQRWVSDIGETCVGVEPMERVADPSVVSALLSLVLATRNKLAALGFAQVTKDPFLHPQAFCATLASYASPNTVPSNSTSLSISSPFHTPHTHFHALSSTPSLGTTATDPAPPAPPPAVAYLTLPMIENISSAFSKGRSSDSRKMHRVLLNKLDDLATRGREAEGVVSDDEEARTSRRATLAATKKGEKSSAVADIGGAQLLSGIGSLASGLGLSGGSGTGAGGLMEPTSDLGALVKVLGTGEKGRDRERDRDREGGGGVRDGTAGSLKGLWRGRVGAVVKMRRDDRGVWSDGETDGANMSEEELEGMPWSGRMQKRIEHWTKLSRVKKGSVDISRGPGGRLVAPPMSNESSSSVGYAYPSMALTSLTMPPAPSRDAADEEDMLSSGQVSPTSGAPPFLLTTAENSTANLFAGHEQNASAPHSALGSVSDYEKRVSAFNKKRPWPSGHGGHQSRVSSWSDPLSAKNLVDEDASHGSSRSRSHTRSPSREAAEPPASGVSESVVWGDDEHRRRIFKHGLRRRHSFHCISSVGSVRVLSQKYMGIDVELCGQLLVLHRREEHLQNVIACLQVLTSTLSTTNASLREDYQSHQQPLSEIGARTQVISQIERERVKADTMTQERSTLLYESEQFRVNELWRMASPPRQKVLDLREKVFGTGGRRLPAGVKGAHGRFNRVQWTLDGGERLVDLMGRTESEVEEEEGLEAMPGHLEEEEEDVVEHPGIKPMWLLRFFTSWGARWSAPKEQPTKASSEAPPEKSPVIPDAEGVQSTS